MELFEVAVSKDHIKRKPLPLAFLIWDCFAVDG
jgi:hypothetical protein